MKERLQKLMAMAGIGSRRANEELIEAGRVRVNGKVAKLGDQARKQAFPMPFFDIFRHLW